MERRFVQGNDGSCAIRFLPRDAGKQQSRSKDLVQDHIRDSGDVPLCRQAPGWDPPRIQGTPVKLRKIRGRVRQQFSNAAKSGGDQLGAEACLTLAKGLIVSYELLRFEKSRTCVPYA